MSDQDNGKKDLTRIEDLSEYLHENDEHEDFIDHTLDEEAPPFFAEEDQGNPVEEHTNNFAEDEINTGHDDSFSEDNSSDDFSFNETEGEIAQDDFEFDNDSGSGDSFEFNANEDLETNEEEDSDTSEFSLDDNDEAATKEEFTTEEFPSFEQEDSITENISVQETATNLNEPPEIPASPHETIAIKESIILDEAASKASENFQEEIKSFAETTPISHLGKEADPSFSMALGLIKNQEDKIKILSTLEKHHLIKDDTDKKRYQEALEQGSLLISRISEFCLLSIYQDLKDLNISFKINYSDLLHNNQKQINTSAAGRYGLINKRQHSFDLSQKQHISAEMIITSSMNQLHNHETTQYIGVITEQTFVKNDVLSSQDTLHHELIEQMPDRETKERLYHSYIKESNIEAGHSQIPHFEQEANHINQQEHIGLKDYYNLLIDKMRPQAVKLGGNAILGIQFSITPLLDQRTHQILNYNISALGNVVWVEQK